MEKKYPIQFSWSQFILLVFMNLILLSLVFFFGARVGGPWFQEPIVLNSPAAPPTVALQLAPSPTPDAPAPESPPAPQNEEEEAEPSDAAPADEAAPEPEVEEAPSPEPMPAPTRPVRLPSALPGTVVRFKSSGASRYSVEVGRYTDERVAAGHIVELRRKGYDAYVTLERAGDLQTYLVRMGLFADRQSAERYATQVSNAQQLDLRVVAVE